MEFQQILFYLYASVLVFSALMVVTIGHPVKAALFLVLAFFSAACVWLLLEAEFLAIVLVLVYVGAVMVLFLFVVMMIDVDIKRTRKGFQALLPVGFLVGVLLLVEMITAITAGLFSPDKMANPAARGAEYSNTRELGEALYTNYLYPFEIAAVILVVAIVAAIVLTFRSKRKEVKYQDPAKQVAVRKKDRLRIVKMKSEKKRGGE